MKRLFFALLCLGLFGCAGMPFVPEAPPAPPPPREGTAAELAAGTETRVRSWAPKTLADTFSGAAAEVQDEAFSALNFNGDTTHAVSQDDFYDLWVLLDKDADGSLADEEELLDWSADQGATNLHAGNIPDLSATYLTPAAAALAYQPLEATLTDIADGTIAEDLVNTANPWADNEVANDITLTNISQITTKPITGLSATNWRIFYSADDGIPVELALGAAGLVLKSNGAAVAPSWETDSTGAGGDQLVDIVTTAPLTVNAGANVNDALPGADADITFAVSAATDSASGVVELSTDAESVTGTSDVVVVTPGTLTARLAAPGAIGGATPGAGTFTTIGAGASGFAVDADGDVTGKSFTSSKVSGTAGDMGLYEANSTDTHAVGFRGPASITGDGAYRGQFPNARPSSANMVQAWTNAGESGTGTAADPYVQATSWVDLDNYQSAVTEGSLADSVIVSADIKDGEVAAADVATVMKTEGFCITLGNGTDAITAGEYYEKAVRVPFKSTLTKVILTTSKTSATALTVDVWIDAPGATTGISAVADADSLFDTATEPAIANASSDNYVEVTSFDSGEAAIAAGDFIVVAADGTPTMIEASVCFEMTRAD